MKKQYRVIKQYIGNTLQAEKLKKGEHVQIIKYSSPHSEWDNWVYCTNGDTYEHWMPIQLLNVHASSAIAKDNYDPTELSAHIGEIIIADYELNGWIWCYKQHDHTYGWFPLNHVQFIE